MSLYAKRLERGCFLWPSSADGVVTITPVQLRYMLDYYPCPAAFAKRLMLSVSKATLLRVVRRRHRPRLARSGLSDCR